MSGDKTANIFLEGPIDRVFFRTALPIILVMVTNGLLTVIDAAFIGRMVGPDALAAVTAMFPIFMFTVALSTLAASGMASRLARQLGAGNRHAGAETRGSALLLTLCLAAVVNLVFLLIGEALIDGAVGGNPALAEMAHAYMAPLIMAAPLSFALSIESDALRSEGRAADMAKLILISAPLNGVFNYLLIGPAGLGVLGSALGTIAAQSVVAGLMIRLRLSGKTPLAALPRLPQPFFAPWGRIMALGLPPALNFMGVSLMAGVVIWNIHWIGAPQKEATLAAYGIITRITALTFLPLLGFNMAAQSLVGNNYGADLMDRVNVGLKTALVTVLAYCAAVEACLMLLAGQTAKPFVDDPAVIAELGRILPIMITGFVLAGPVMILAGFFQALGDAGRAAALGLGRIYLFSLPLLMIVPRQLGEIGIWLASPIADVSAFLLAGIILAMTAWRTGRRWGLFFAH